MRVRRGWWGCVGGLLCFDLFFRASCVQSDGRICENDVGVTDENQTGKSLAVEWADFARVNTVSPGFIQSGLTAAVPEEVKDRLREKTPLRFVIPIPLVSTNTNSIAELENLVEVIRLRAS